MSNSRRHKRSLHGAQQETGSGAQQETVGIRVHIVGQPNGARPDGMNEKAQGHPFLSALLWVMVAMPATFPLAIITYHGKKGQVMALPGPSRTTAPRKNIIPLLAEDVDVALSFQRTLGTTRVPMSYSGELGSPSDPCALLRRCLSPLYCRVPSGSWSTSWGSTVWLYTTTSCTDLTV